MQKFLALAVVMITSYSGIYACSAATPYNCGTVILPLYAQITSLNPILTDSLFDQQIAQLSYLDLVWINRFGKIDLSRSLAREIVVGADGSTYDVKMRPWNWSDGKPVTAYDVEYTFGLLKQLEAQNPGSSAGGMPGIVKSFIVVNDNEFKLVLTHPANSNWFIFNGLSQLLPLPSHAWSRYTLSKIVSSQNSAAFFNVVDGPLRVTSLGTGLEIVLEPSGTIGSAALHFDRLVFKYVVNDESAWEGVTSGDFDMILLPNMFTKIASETAGIHVETLPPEPGWSYIALNFKNPKNVFFHDPEVRRAIQDSIDQNALIKLALHGQGLPDFGPVPTSQTRFLSPGMRAGIYPVGFDLPKARDLLSRDGYALGADGFRHKGNIRLSFAIMVVTADPSAEQLSEIIQSQLRALGIEVKLHLVDFNQLLAAFNGAPEGWDAAVLATTVSGYPSGESMFGTGSYMNAGGYSDHQMDKFIAESIGRQGSAGLYKYEDYASAQQPVIFFVSPIRSFAVRNRIHDFKDFLDPALQISPEKLSCTSAN